MPQGTDQAAWLTVALLIARLIFYAGRFRYGGDVQISRDGGDCGTYISLSPDSRWLCRSPGSPRGLKRFSSFVS